MIRRTLRIGMRLGLVGGLAVAVFKMVQSRRTPRALPDDADGWQPAPSPPSSGATGPRLAADPQPEPVAAEDVAAEDVAAEDVAAEDVAAESAPPVAGPTAGPAGRATRPAKAVARAPSPAAEAAARAAAESAARNAVAKAASAKATAEKGASAQERDDVGAPAEQAATVSWVQAQEGACPSSHPVKARLASRIFHLPGMAAYQRTAADRCYRDEASAEADGLRKAKR